MQPRRGAGALQRLHGPAFQDAGADPPQHVIGTALLNDDVVDAGLAEQLPEQQSGGAGADDGNLGTHGLSPYAWF